MNVILKSISAKFAFFALITGMSALLSCSASNSKESQVIKIDGSSTVYPVTQVDILILSSLPSLKLLNSFLS